MGTIDPVLDKAQIEEAQDLHIVEDQAGPQHKPVPNISIEDVVSEVVVAIVEEEEVTMVENPETLDRGAHIKQK